MLSIAGALGALPYIGMVIATGLLWNTFIDNPAVRHEARQGYIATVELEAAKVTLAEKERQAQAAIVAGNKLSEMLKEQTAALAERSRVREQELETYAEQIKREKRSCPLSADDLRRLQR